MVIQMTNFKLLMSQSVVMELHALVHLCIYSKKCTHLNECSRTIAVSINSCMEKYDFGVRYENYDPIEYDGMMVLVLVLRMTVTC